MSVNVGDFMVEVGKIPRGKLWFEHGKLKVYVPELEYVLVLKILAARGKDMPDIQFLFQYLGITRRKQVERLLKRIVNLFVGMNESDKGERKKTLKAMRNGEVCAAMRPT